LALVERQQDSPLTERPRGKLIEGMGRVGPVMAVPALLSEFQVEMEPLLAEFQLLPSHFTDPENVLTFTTMGRILRRCVERTGCEHFGLLLGQRAGLSALGALGFLMQSAPDVRTALKLLGQHLHVHDRGGIVALREDGADAILSYTIVQTGIEQLDQFQATAMAIGLNIMRGFCGHNWRPGAVRFPFKAPIDVKPYRLAFGVSPTFDSDCSALVFPLSVLDRPLAAADPLLHRLMEERVHELERLSQADLVSGLRRILRTLVGQPNCSLEFVAHQLGTHARTLSRRLHAKGTTFLQLREEVSLQVARELLEESSKPAREIAATVGYADGSSFSRAFRRWSGKTPAQWRRAGRSRHE
jgi:AraC-like DNA-binding protein